MHSGIGVCSWSIQQESAAALGVALDRLHLNRCQLALVPLARNEQPWEGAVETLRGGGVAVPSGMIAMVEEDYSTLETIRRTGGVAPDEHWEENLDLARRVAEVARRDDVPLVTFHTGFLPHERGSPQRMKLLHRLRAIADCFAKQGIDLAFETGQETADTLLDVLVELDRSNVGVNFDPANMILYGMGDPVEALAKLAPHVRQIHVKDALPTTQPGTWGCEVPAGEGAVDWDGFFAIVRDLPQEIDLMIEREAGPHRERDIARARDLVLRHVRPPGSDEPWDSCPKESAP